MEPLQVQLFNFTSLIIIIVLEIIIHKYELKFQSHSSVLRWERSNYRSASPTPAVCKQVDKPIDDYLRKHLEELESNIGDNVISTSIFTRDTICGDKAWREKHLVPVPLNLL